MTVHVTGQSWPQKLLVPQTSIVILNCTTNLPSAYWGIRIQADNFQRELLFTDIGDNRKILYETGVYQFNILGTLRLKINETVNNNQTVVRCLSRSHVILETTFFVWYVITITYMWLKILA